MVWGAEERKWDCCYCYMELVLFFIRRCLLNGPEFIKKTHFQRSLNVNPFLVSLARGYLCEHEITFSCYFLGYRSIFIGLLVLFLHFRRLCLLLRKYVKIYNVTKELLTRNHNYLFYLKSTIKPSKDFWWARIK